MSEKKRLVAVVMAFSTAFLTAFSRVLSRAANLVARAAKTLFGLVMKALAWLLVLPILFYQHFITPYTPPSCRFTPTCSEYGRQALLKHGPIKGLLLTLWRILRCNPWGGSGYDPVPPKGKWRNETTGKDDGRGEGEREGEGKQPLTL